MRKTFVYGTSESYQLICVTRYESLYMNHNPHSSNPRNGHMYEARHRSPRHVLDESGLVYSWLFGLCGNPF
jgi:hypothetical protein